MIGSPCRGKVAGIISPRTYIRNVARATELGMRPCQCLLAKVPINGASPQFAYTFHPCRGGTSASPDLEC